MRTLILLLSVVITASAADLTAGDAWARATAPSAGAGGVFMTLKNSGKNAGALLSARSDVADSVELHTHTKGDDGVWRMGPVARIEVPAGGETVLKPGGLHVMLIGLKHGLSTGSTLDLTLTFADGATQTLAVPVRDAAAMSAATENAGGVEKVTSPEQAAAAVPTTTPDCKPACCP